MWTFWPFRNCGCTTLTGKGGRSSKRGKTRRTTGRAADGATHDHQAGGRRREFRDSGNAHRGQEEAAKAGSSETAATALTGTGGRRREFRDNGNAHQGRRRLKQGARKQRSPGKVADATDAGG